MSRIRDTVDDINPALPLGRNVGSLRRSPQTLNTKTLNPILPIAWGPYKVMQDINLTNRRGLGFRFRGLGKYNRNPSKI